MSNQNISRNRAFLSHSTTDKTFVNQVANRLGKQRVVVDDREFTTGIQFLNAIREALSTSQVFVLFASKSSLRSFWVTFEINEVEELMRSKVIAASIVFIIDNETRHSDLPSWMQRALISRTSRPTSAARIIEYHLNSLLGSQSKQFFIGRGEQMQQLTSLLIPPAGEPPPHIVVVSGLPLTGRRTLLKAAFTNILSIRTFVVLTLRPTDSIDFLHLQLLQELGSLDSRRQFNEARREFQGLDLGAQSDLLAEMLASCCTDGSAVLIVDEGALLDPTGKYTNEALALMKALQKQPRAYVGFIHLRRPGVSPLELAQMQAVYLRVPPLSSEATGQLLTQSLRTEQIAFSENDVNELAPYLKGFPPSVTLAVSLIKDRGMSLVKADKRMLVGLQTQTFTDLLNGLGLSETEWKILRFLAAGLALPFEGFVTLSQQTSEEIVMALTKLVDFSLIQPTEEGYSISGPIRFAVQAIGGYLSESEYQEIARRLQAVFWSDPEQLPPLQVVDSTIQAVLQGGGDSNDELKDFVIPSALFRAAKNLSDQRGHDSLAKARTLLQRLLGIEPQHRKGLTLLCKIYARLGEFQKAKQQLQRITTLGYSERYFLTAFILWKERKFSDATVAFRTALAKGINGFEIYHGLGACLLRLGELDEAERTVEEGSRDRKPNKMLIDLAAQIAIEEQDYAKAEDLIDQLLTLRADADYHHRKATLLNAQGKYREALPHARFAAADFTRRFEAETVLVDTLIELGDFEEATTRLDDLQRREQHQRDRRDIVLGLRCKIWLGKEDWRQAESMSYEIENKNTQVYSALRGEILKLKIADLTISPGDKLDARQEIERLYLDGSTIPFLLAAEDDLEDEDAVDEI